MNRHTSLEIGLAALAVGASCDVVRGTATALAERCGDPVDVVTKFDDTRDGECTDDDCSLHEALTNAVFCGGDRTVRLAPGIYRLAQIDNETHGPNAFPAIRTMVTIEGNGATIERSTAVGTPEFRIFLVLPRGQLVLDGVTIRNGLAREPGSDVRPFEQPANKGGAIFNLGLVTLRESTLARNEATYDGGAIANLGVLRVEAGSAIEENSALNEGGGIFNGSDALRQDLTASSTSVSLEVRESRVAGNRAEQGGGITNHAQALLDGAVVEANTARLGGGGIMNVIGAHLAVLRSTLVDNVTEESGFGGGIYNKFGTVEVRAVTLHRNRAGFGGALMNDGAATLADATISNNEAVVGGGGGINLPGARMLEVSNTILAGNIGGDCGIAGVLTATGANLHGDGSCTSFTIRADPLLGALQDNGGPTPTLLPNADSPAVDAGTACMSTDQRGEPRPIRACDIGAVERQPDDG